MAKKETPTYHNYIKEYYSKIESGEIVACEKVRKVYKQLAFDCDNTAGQWHFDIRKATRPIVFVERFCRQSKTNTGQLIHLELFQKAALQAIFGFVDKDGLRKYHEVIWIMGRKNGKSTALSAIGLYCMLTEPGAEVDCVATKRDQAKIVFDSAVAMVKQSPDLARIIHKRRTDMTCEANLSVFQPLASDSNTMQGLNASCGIIDELSSIKDNEIYTAIKYSQSARPEPLLIEISTNGTVRECIFDQQYDYAAKVIAGKVKNDRLLPLIYELDSPEEWTDEDCWIKANPGLGTIKSRADLRQHVEDAKHKPSEKRDVLVYDFNVKQTDSTAWLSYEQLWNPATFVMDDVRDTYAIGGADLSATTDLTCASLIIHTATEDIPYVLQQYFLPEKRVKDVETMNTQEAPYRKWADRGLLTICPGSMVDYHMVTAWFKRMRDEYGIDLWKLGYDRAMANYWRAEMEGEFGQNVMEAVAQGPYTWSQPMKELGSALADKRLNYNGNPMLAWCISNTAVKTTGTLDVIQPVKIHRTGRIDGLVSLLNAWVIYDKYQEDYFNLIGYDTGHFHNTILN